MSKIHYYEICFYGEENPENEAYDPNRACSYCIKTEIPNITKETALAILYPNPDKKQLELIKNCTAVNEITDTEAKDFDIEDLVIKNEDRKGVYYTRPTERRKS